MSLNSVKALAGLVEQGRKFLADPGHGDYLRETVDHGRKHFDEVLDLTDPDTQEIAAVLVDDLAHFVDRLRRVDETAAHYINNYAIAMACILATVIDEQAAKAVSADA